MSEIKCCIPGCRRNEVDEPDVHIFAFPENDEMKNEWLTVIPIENYTPSIYGGICELHFDEKYINDGESSKSTKSKRPSLKPNAVPSKFPEISDGSISEIDIDDEFSSHSENHNYQSKKKSKLLAEDMKSIDEIELISLVEKKPELWQPNHPHYGHTCLKSKIWSNIGVQLGFRASACKNRWSNIRDQYRRSLKKAVTDPDGRVYRFHKQLRFLRPTILEGLKYFCFRNMNLKDSSVTGSSSDMLKRIRDLEETCENEVPQKRLCSMGTNRNVNSNDDAVEAFLAGLLPTLKNLTPYYLNLAKSKIFMTVQKFEMQMFMETQNRELEYDDPVVLPGGDDLEMVEPIEVDIKDILVEDK